MTAVASLSLFFLAAGVEVSPQVERDADEAIDRAVDHLLLAVEGPKGWAPEENYQSGYAALQVYALVKGDVSFQHPIIQKGLAAMEGPFEKVYSVALYIMACGAILEQIDGDTKLAGTRPPTDRAKLLERMNAALGWLLQARLKGVGAWNYELPNGKVEPRKHRFDHSNTQFAVLALGTAARHGLKVPAEVWEEVADHFIETQEKEGEEVTLRPVFRGQKGAMRGGAEGAGSGRTIAKKQTASGAESETGRARGWNYSEPTDETKFSMVCAGLSSALLANQSLPRAGPRVEGLRKSIRDGYAWTTRFLNAGPRPLGKLYNLAYDLYSLEKVGDLGEVEAFAEYRWYEEGVIALRRQQKRDGSISTVTEEAISRRDTALALLFLARATDLSGRARSLSRAITSAAGGRGESRSTPGRIYLPSFKADYPVFRIFRMFRFRQLKQVQKMVEEAVKVYDPERTDEVVRLLLPALGPTAFPEAQAMAKKLLASAAGIELEDAAKYSGWAERWSEVVRIGKAADSASVDRLRELLRSAEGAPLKARIAWALERTGGRAALGDLLELLESPDPALREAGYRAVVFLSKTDLPFHPRGAGEARAAEVRALRAWIAAQKTEDSGIREQAK